MLENLDMKKRKLFYSSSFHLDRKAIFFLIIEPITVRNTGVISTVTYFSDICHVGTFHLWYKEITYSIFR